MNELKFVLTQDGPFELPAPIRCLRIMFTRSNKGSRDTVKFFREHCLSLEFKETRTVRYMNAEGTSHEDMLPLIQGECDITGMIPGDTLEIVYKLPTPKTPFVVMSDREVAEAQTKYRREQSSHMMNIRQAAQLDRRQ